METIESMIEDLRQLGDQVNQIPAYRPTDQQLKEMRDGLSNLNKRAGLSRN